MTRLLVHLATGPENPTRAALALLVARSALDAGHQVDVFIAGDGVGVLRPETLDAGHGIGTGSH
jgi:predicted peroxiredoxin